MAGSAIFSRNKLVFWNTLTITYFSKHAWKGVVQIKQMLLNTVPYYMTKKLDWAASYYIVAAYVTTDDAAAWAIGIGIGTNGDRGKLMWNYKI